VKDIEPEVVADSILWTTRAGTSVRQFRYEYTTDKWQAPDMTRVAKHIAKGETAATSGIVDMDFQAEPVPILWCVRADGQLCGMTYETQEQVYGWFRLTTDGEIESVAVISVEDGEDEVWVIAKRTIDGSDLRYIEYFKPHDFYGEIKDCFFVHSGLTYDGGAAVNITDITKADPAVVTVASWPADGSGVDLADGDKVRITGVTGMTEVNLGLLTAYTVANADKGALTFELSGIDSTGWTAYDSGGTVQKVTNTLSGLDHLEGESTAILVDGAAHPAETVASGAITLDYYGNLIHVGLPYNSIVEPMKIAAGSALGTNRGKKQKVTKITVAFYETYGAKAGPDQDNLKSIAFGTGTTPALFTGDKDFQLYSDWGNEATITIVQDQPLPMTILAIVPHLTVNE
jgi:hypothetical protein